MASHEPGATQQDASTQPLSATPHAVHPGSPHPGSPPLPSPPPSPPHPPSPPSPPAYLTSAVGSLIHGSVVMRTKPRIPAFICPLLKVNVRAPCRPKASL